MGLNISSFNTMLTDTRTKLARWTQEGERGICARGTSYKAQIGLKRRE